MGRFMGDPAFAWIPAGLFKAVSNAQMNWIAAYSNSSVYVALLSQSFEHETVQLELNDALVDGLEGVVQSTVWVNNIEQAKPIEVRNGVFKTSVPPKGIVALRLVGARAKTRLQHKVLSADMPPLSPLSRVVSDGAGPFGIVSGIVLRWGK